MDHCTNPHAIRADGDVPNFVIADFKRSFRTSRASCRNQDGHLLAELAREESLVARRPAMTAISLPAQPKGQEPLSHHESPSSTAPAKETKFGLHRFDEYNSVMAGRSGHQILLKTISRSEDNDAAFRSPFRAMARGLWCASSLPFCNYRAPAHQWCRC
jgi:hypothetical protein